MRASLQSWLNERNRFLLEGEASEVIASFFEDLRNPGQAEDRAGHEQDDEAYRFVPG